MSYPAAHDAPTLHGNGRWSSSKVELERGVIVNAAISGARAQDLLGLYRRAWHRSDPDLIVVQLWWDQVRLTRYRQRLFGEELAGELEPYLRRAARTPRKGLRGS